MHRRGREARTACSRRSAEAGLGAAHVNAGFSAERLGRGNPALLKRAKWHYEQTLAGRETNSTEIARARRGLLEFVEARRALASCRRDGWAGACDQESVLKTTRYSRRRNAAPNGRRSRSRWTPTAVVLIGGDCFERSDCSSPVCLAAPRALRARCCFIVRARDGL